ncbi:hypothetical protein HMPREF9098_0739 [Kingella denitrificans ATCC 33394]|uniref:Uncharacterized protein n=1 Tax=Kingella denitrificans ATCC 33394 TaxID=888741 RepID=F0EXR4_9NEIS|nr:hypothetical protein HMPREF9098_0739 [Kingella denitrificans ATCC 33394]
MVFRVQAAFCRESCRIKVQAAFIGNTPPQSMGMAAQRHANFANNTAIQKSSLHLHWGKNAGCFLPFVR